MYADIGVIGLAVMGQNLILNMNDSGFNVVVYNRTISKIDHFLNNEAKHTNIVGSISLENFVSLLKLPRRIMLLVKAGPPVDEFIFQLFPLLSPGDIIIDGGNSLFLDTKRRCEELESKGLLFVGCGVSGGEEGARSGPSLMPGGSIKAWMQIKDIFQKISAVANGFPCCEWVGPSGAGHFVKMVHNGIEYGDMQLIAETYDIAKRGLKLSHLDLAALFERWSEKGSDLESFLVEITTNILKFKDQQGDVLVEKIRDTAGQKGTGKWTVMSTLDLGVPGSLFSEAVFARSLSSQKSERVMASKVLSGPQPMNAEWNYSIEESCFDLRDALYAAKIISYVQGFRLIFQSSIENNWDLNFSGIAQIWQGGCIIRSALLNRIKDAFSTDNLKKCNGNLLFDLFFQETLKRCQDGWRRIVSSAVLNGIPVPALSSALAYYDGIRSSQLPANLIQAQRDYFGAHTYELDNSPGLFIHTNWTGRGGDTSSTSYSA